MGGVMPLKTKKSSLRSSFSFFSMPKVVRRFKDDEDGVTAVEFSMLAFPFFMLMMAIIESSLMFFAGQVLESAVDDVGRQIRTGQLAENMTEIELRTAICDASAVLFKCQDLKIDMQVVATFDDLDDVPSPTPAGVLDDSDFSFTPPGPKEVVMVSVLTEWPIYTNFLQQSMSNLQSKNALLSAVAVFKTEPYS